MEQSELEPTTLSPFLSALSLLCCLPLFSSTHASGHHLLQESTSLSLFFTSKVTFAEF